MAAFILLYHWHLSFLFFLSVSHFLKLPSLAQDSQTFTLMILFSLLLNSQRVFHPCVLLLMTCVRLFLPFQGLQKHSAFPLPSFLAVHDETTF